MSKVLIGVFRLFVISVGMLPVAWAEPIQVEINSSVAVSKEYKKAWNEYLLKLNENSQSKSPEVFDQYPTLRKALEEGIQRLLQAQVEVLESEASGLKISSAKAVVRLVQSPSINASIFIPRKTMLLMC